MQDVRQSRHLASLLIRTLSARRNNVNLLINSCRHVFISLTFKPTTQDEIRIKLRNLTKNYRLGLKRQ
jgi:hypothetical protein